MSALLCQFGRRAEAVFPDRNRSAEERLPLSDRRCWLARSSMSEQWQHILNWRQKFQASFCVTIKIRNMLPGLTLRAPYNRFFFLTHFCSQRTVRGRSRADQRTFASISTVLTPLSRKGHKTHSCLSKLFYMVTLIGYIFHLQENDSRLFAVNWQYLCFTRKMTLFRYSVSALHIWT